jgi:hypothetical protein
MLRGKHLWSQYRYIAQSFSRSNYNSGQQLQSSLAEKLKTLASDPDPIVFEVKAIAEVVHKSASLLGDLQSLPFEKRQYQHIQGSVPMPLSLINRLDDTEISSSSGLFNFIIRTYYGPLYEKCTTRRNGVIGTPGIAKSVSLLYPLLDHFLPSKTCANSSPVLLHSVARGDAYLFFNGSCWELKKFITSPKFDSLHVCLSNYPGLLYLVDGPTGNTSHIGNSLKGENTRTILASSPDRENYCEFLKQGFRFLMPCWSLDELLEARKLVSPTTTEHIVRDRYNR